MADTDVRDVIERALLNTECPHGLGRFACAPCRSAAVVAALAEAGLHEAKLNAIVSGRSVVVPAEDVRSLFSIAEQCVGLHERVVMDTPEDRDRHQRAITAMKDALTTVRAALPATEEESHD